MKNIDLGPHNRADQPSEWAEDVGLKVAKVLIYSAAASLSILAVAGALWVLGAAVRSLS